MESFDEESKPYLQAKISVVSEPLIENLPVEMTALVRNVRASLEKAVSLGKNISPELYKLAHDSSPVSAVSTWRSPVLFIHGDDDRNVYFTQSVDLVARLREKGGVEIEQLIFPDEIHDFLLYRNWLAAYHAASDFFDRKLKPSGK